MRRANSLRLAPGGVERRWLGHSIEVTAGTIALRTCVHDTALPLAPVTAPDLAVEDQLRADELPEPWSPVERDWREVEYLAEQVEGDDEISPDDHFPPSSFNRITEWSDRSRVRMMRTLASIDWTKPQGVPEMMTFTYPAVFPTDGAEVKEHMRRFLGYWERKWGKPPEGTWKMEFQGRGAPHVHGYAFRQHADVNGKHYGWQETLRWARDTWFTIVSGVKASTVHDLFASKMTYAEVAAATGLDESSLWHLDQGVRFDRQFRAAERSARSIAWYFVKHQSKTPKHLQNKVPDGGPDWHGPAHYFTNVGRFWGIWRGGNTFGPERETYQLTTEEFVRARRVLLRLARANQSSAKPAKGGSGEAFYPTRTASGKPTKRKVKGYGRLQGLWVLCDDPEAVLLQVLEASRSPGRDRAGPRAGPGAAWGTPPLHEGDAAGIVAKSSVPLAMPAPALLV